MTRMEFKDINKTKLAALGLGGLLGLSHLGMIGLLAQRESKFPKFDLPVSEYTSYSVQANEEGYAINYRSNDPLVMATTKTLPGIILLVCITRGSLDLYLTLYPVSPASTS